MIKTALGIAKEEGVHNLWQGLTPAIYRHVIYSGIRIVTYESMRDKVLKKEIDGTFPLWFVFIIMFLKSIKFSIINNVISARKLHLIKKIMNININEV